MTLTERRKLIKRLSRAGYGIIEIAGALGVPDATVCQVLQRSRGKRIKLNPPKRCPWCHMLVDHWPPEGPPCIRCWIEAGQQLRVRLGLNRS